LHTWPEKLGLFDRDFFHYRVIYARRSSKLCCIRVSSSLITIGAPVVLLLYVVTEIAYLSHQIIVLLVLRLFLSPFYDALCSIALVQHSCRHLAM
jgi:hypothetical protein